jgi:AcrR family transcriptional regulator
MSKKPRPVGRPTDYRPAFVEKAGKLFAGGSTVYEVANYLGIAVSTIYKWFGEHADFAEACRLGRETADQRIEHSLYHRANGYSFESERVFQFQGQIVRASVVEHVPPDTGAAIFWLKNRRPKEWREKQELEHSGTLTLEELVLASMKKDEEK